MSYNKLSNIMTEVMESYDFAITSHVTDWLRAINRRNKKSEKSEDLPDLIDESSVKHVYFVAESKDNDLQNSQLCGSEESKIECTYLHFKAISDNCYIYDVAKDYKSLYDIVTK